MSSNLPLCCARAGLAALVLLGTQFGPSVVMASPWASPGDRQARFDIELLADFGIIEGPITTWPISWAQVSRSISDHGGETYPPYVEAAIDRLRAKMPNASDYRGLGYEADIKATNRPRIVRGFDGGARQDADARVSVDKHFSSTYVKMSVNFRDDPRDNNVQFDDSYIAQAVGNWVFYGGTLDQWWGPGFDAGMILSNNARPFPKVGLMRLDPKPFKTKLLSWLGPWQFNVFAGRLASNRNDFAHPILAGMRLSFRPMKGLSIGLSRTLQLCGKGRPCSLNTWGRALIGLGNLDNTGTPQEPGNQLAGIDIRYSSRVGDNTLSLFVEGLGEDEDLQGYSFSFGGSFAGAFSRGDKSWRVTVGYSDTFSDRLWVANRDPGSTYNHFIYTDGYSYKGRTIGHSLDTDSRLLSLGAYILDNRERQYYVRFRRADINSSGRGHHKVSDNHENINIAELGTVWPTRFGDFSAGLRVSNDLPNTPGISNFSAAVEAGWQVRF